MSSADSHAPESVHVTQVENYQFDVKFAPDRAPVRADEPPPLGGGTGPSPVQLLSAAVGNCLSASLLFALRKYKQQPEPISAEVTAQVGRNEQNRLRVLGLAVTLKVGQPAAALQHLDRALAQFEDFCTVTQSVRASIPVAVEVFDSEGVKLK